MEFLEDMVHRLYVGNTRINGLLYDPFDFIEAKRKEADCPAKVFYQNLRRATGNHFGAKVKYGEMLKVLLAYCDKKISELEKGTSSPLKKEQYGTFREVFINPNNYDKTIKALRRLKVIDKLNNNLVGGKLKGLMFVLIKVLRTERRMITNVKDKDLTVLLNKEFTGLSLSERTDGRTLRTTNKSAENLYRTKLLALIS